MQQPIMIPATMHSKQTPPMTERVMMIAVAIPEKSKQHY